MATTSTALQPTPQLVPGPQQVRAQGGIGASEAATAIGVNPYQRPIDAWLRLTGRTPAFAGNEATFWGQALEAVIRAHYVERNNVVVHVPPTSLWHPTLPWLKAMPDGIVLDEHTLQALYVAPQVKSVGLRMADRWQDGQIPEEYVIQAVIEMAVTNLDRLDFAVLIGAQSYEQPTVHRDAELEGMVLEQLGEFWRCVQEDRPPPLDESKSYRAHLLRQIKRKQVVEAGAADLLALERWRDVTIEAKKLKFEEKRLKNVIAAALSAANANVLSSDFGDIKVGAPRRKTGWKDAAEAMAPALAALARIERELADIAADDDNASGDILKRIAAMSAGLTLLRGSGLQSYEEVVASHTELGDPVLNRPRKWTADVVGFDDENEEG